MTRILTVDVGTGTQDILLFESGKTIENNFKLVMPSPTVIVAGRIRQATVRGEALLLTGTLMGGGPCHWAARDHALAGYQVVISEDAARTFDDDLSMVAKMGFEIVTNDEATRYTQQEFYHIEMQDFAAQALITALQAFDVSPRVDALAIAAFDHGAAPPQISDRRFRFDFIAETMRRDPQPSAFAYPAAQTPTTLTRLQAIAASTRLYLSLSGSPANLPMLLMDTGSAAALGMLEDPLVRTKHECVLCNIGNFHTLAFHMYDSQIIGTFEHHTGELTRPQLEDLLVKLVNGTLTNDEVFNTSGHGALLLPSARAASTNFPFLAVTGPRREVLRGSQLHPYEAVPHGDMMLTGNFGLLRALADHYPELAIDITPALA